MPELSGSGQLRSTGGFTYRVLVYRGGATDSWQCEAAVMALRWPDGFRCPRCLTAAHYVVGHGARKLLQCQDCRHQTSLTAGTLMDSTKLPLRTWSLAMFLISQDKTGLSSLALKRQLGTSYRKCGQDQPRADRRLRPGSAAEESATHATWLRDSGGAGEVQDARRCACRAR